MVVCFFGKAGHVGTVPLEQRCTANSEWYTAISLEKLEKQTRKDDCSKRQCEFSHCGSNQRIFDRPNRRIDGSTAAQLGFGTQ